MNLKKLYIDNSECYVNINYEKEEYIMNDWRRKMHNITLHLDDHVKKISFHGKALSV